MKYTNFSMRTLLTFAFILFAGSHLQAQSSAPSPKILDVIKSIQAKDCSLLEVSGEMFKLMSQDNRATPEIKDTFSEISHLIYLDCRGIQKDSTFIPLYSVFDGEAIALGFELLMRSEKKSNSYHFYRRSKGKTNEYILVGDVKIQYMATTLNIVSVQQLTNIISIAGDAGGL